MSTHISTVFAVSIFFCAGLASAQQVPNYYIPGSHVAPVRQASNIIQRCAMSNACATPCDSCTGCGSYGCGPAGCRGFGGGLRGGGGLLGGGMRGGEYGEGGMHPNKCNMPQHHAYFPNSHGTYYFHPYNYSTVLKQQDLVKRYGGDPKNPYDNRIFQAIYDDLESRNGGGALTVPDLQLSPSRPVNLQSPSTRRFAPPLPFQNSVLPASGRTQQQANPKRNSLTSMIVPPAPKAASPSPERTVEVANVQSNSDVQKQEISLSNYVHVGKRKEVKTGAPQ